MESQSPKVIPNKRYPKLAAKSSKILGKKNQFQIY